MNVFDILSGDTPQHKIKKLQSIVDRINRLEDGMRDLSDQELLRNTTLFKERLAAGETTDDIVPEAFALVREASRRTLGQRHFDVQMLGGVILHRGGVAEMRTGEGKTLVATLPTYLNALSGKGVHVVTVNDYLSRRDAVWMGQVYHMLGLSVAVINHEASFIYDPTHKELDTERDETGSFKVVHEFLRPVSRREAYAADITYGTNNEFGFDYLRDNIAYRAEDMVQREHHFAIVDEVDSILIDEARTPLIISAKAEEAGALYVQFARIASTLEKEGDYIVDEKFKTIQITDQGIEKAERALGVENIYTDKGITFVHHLEIAVRAKALFERDRDYVVRDGQIIIVDEFTGRLQPGRRWSEGLHQAVEAKENVPIQNESRTVASITFQNYFRLYTKLAGMTGTALTSSEELYKVYGLDVIPIPTNKVSQRVDYNDLIFQTERGKFKALSRKVKELQEKGQPVLIGTVSVENNELLSAYLTKEGIRHDILNAKQHEKEGEVIAQAGRKGSVVVATNMAGRGVDIKLGGNPGSPEMYEEVKALGGLYVIGTERHEARRIDDQLRGRAGRQGDPGATQFYVSLEDTLMRVFASDAIKKMMGRFGIPEDEPVENGMITRSLEQAQKKIEGFNFDARKRVLEFDDVMNKQRTAIYRERKELLFGSQEHVEAYYVRIAETYPDIMAILTERKDLLGAEVFWNIARRLALQTTDMLWMEHLEAMDHLRGSVNLRAYGQRDPLVEYKKEGLRMFHELEAGIMAEIAGLLPNVGAGAFVREEQKLQEVHLEESLADDVAAATGVPVAVPGAAASPVEPVHGEEKIGRNDPCPCGSGKKYKKCHGV
ncbi:MAG: preprotein translocase subunit SecA [Candidatus Yonathbacteria bacterium]|nr:preprotein translocase subunit SecA [Candidatus Yonathbacteria bacterium]